MKDLYIISDAHLGANKSLKDLENQNNRFFTFLNYVAENNGDLLICGDLFDFWFEYKYAIPRQHVRVLSHLIDVKERGCNIHYIGGNHDFWMGSFFEKELGIPVHPNEYEFTCHDYKIFTMHGDGLLKNDYGYRFMKRVFRHPLNIFLYRWIHPDIGIPLALSMSHLSRKSSKDEREKTDIDYREFAFKKLDQGYDIVILGHTHWPALTQHNNGYYVNAGNWINDFTFGVISADGPALYQWQDEQAIPFEPPLPPGIN